MKKLWLLILYACVVLTAPCPLNAKRRHVHRKKTTKTCTTKQTVHKTTSTPKTAAPMLPTPKIAPQHNYLDAVVAQPALSFNTGTEKSKTSSTIVPQKSSTVQAHRPHKHKKRRTCVIRRRKIKHARCSTQQMSPHYSPEQLKKITKLRTLASFAWPIKKSDFYISSPYGRRRNPNGTAGFHGGVDMAAVKGTSVFAVADAIVLDARPYKGYGNMILLGHRHKLFTRYAHLDRILVKKGQIVRKGTVIGRVGNTGHVRRRKGHDGSHLHWETYIKGKRVNPRLFI